MKTQFNRQKVPSLKYTQSLVLGEGMTRGSQNAMSTAHLSTAEQAGSEEKVLSKRKCMAIPFNEG